MRIADLARATELGRRLTIRQVLDLARLDDGATTQVARAVDEHGDLDVRTSPMLDTSGSAG